MEQRNREVDFLRFVFAVIIMLHHSRYVLGDENCLFLGGSLAVEFFFIVSGYLMMASILRAERRQSAGVTRAALGTETYHFLLRKIRAFLPEYLIAWFIGFFLIEGFGFPGPRHVLHDFGKYFFELSLIKMSGIFTGGIDGCMWYLSAMLLCMAVLYPLIRRHKNFMVHIGAPLTALFLLGYLCRTFGHPRDPVEWTGLVYKGDLRAMAELCLGVVAFYAAARLRMLRLTKPAHILIRLAGTGIYTAVIFYMYKEDPSTADYFYIFLLLIAVIFTFSGQGAGSGLFDKPAAAKLTQFCAKYSTALYFSHLYFAQHINNVLTPAHYSGRLRMTVYVAVSLLNGLLVLLLAGCWRKHGKKLTAALRRFLIAQA